MRRVVAGVAGLVVAAAVGVGVVPTGVAAPVASAAAEAPGGVARRDDLAGPLEDARRELRQEALAKVLGGSLKAERRGASTVVRVGNKTKAARKGQVAQYVELSREKTDKIFVVLAEFGDERHPDYPDVDSNLNIAGPTTYDGPVHNAIPQPDRAVDNYTVWQQDYNRQHFQDLYFGNGNSLKKYYEKQSSGRYSVDGTVTDWVKVKYNEARYGRSDGFPCPDRFCSNTHNLVADAVNQWVADQKAKGRTTAQITADLKAFDQWDRYDFDGDGNFNEPDGYIDHFQIVHAGGDQSDGDPHQGEDAIWAHRWYAFYGQGGPASNPLGGAQIGDTGLWVGDYTIQPENGGVSIFAHEFAHDLGLPDEYDYSGAPIENSVAWWSLMAQSRQSAPGDGGVGEQASDLNAWDKLQLGWLDYEIVNAGQTRTVELGPHEYNSDKAQGLVVTLPKKQKVTQLVPPAAGAKSWWSGSGDAFTHTMKRQLTLPADAPAALTFQANWEIEDCGPDPCDYAYVEVDDGKGFKPIPGSIAKVAEGNGIDGKSNGWVPATFDLSPYAGKTVGLRFRYATDANTTGLGFFADDVKVTSGTTTVVDSGAETSPDGWTLDGFSAQGATYTSLHDNYYVASHLNYVSYDQHLKTGPYYFGSAAKPWWVQHFPYQDGLMIWYWDTSQKDNNVNQHPGEGQILPIDSHPVPINRLDGTFWPPRIASYDAPFGLEKADSFTLDRNGQPNYVRGQDAVPTFNDSKAYWTADQPQAGVKIPNNRVNISVKSRTGTTMRVQVSARK